MQHIGINNLFSTDTIQWIDQLIKIKSLYHYDMMTMNSPIFEDYKHEEVLSEAYAELFKATDILD